MNHYDNYLETKTILGLCDNYYTGVRDMMPVTDPEYTAKQAFAVKTYTAKAEEGAGRGE